MPVLYKDDWEDAKQRMLAWWAGENTIWSGGYPGNKRMAAFLGCEVTLSWDTGWIEPLLTGEDLSHVFSLRLDENEPHLQFALRLLRRGVVEARDKSLVTIGAFGGVGDTLAALRGTERLLVDLIQRPDQVARAELFLMDLWCDVYDRFYEIVKDVDEGSDSGRRASSTRPRTILLIRSHRRCSSRSLSLLLSGRPSFSTIRSTTLMGSGTSIT